MSDREWVRELMLPLLEYTTVEVDATLQDALRSLVQARRKAGRSTHPHRSVLVRHRDGTIAGWLGYHAILAALRPVQRSVVLDDAMKRAGVSEELMSRSMEMLRFLQPNFPSLRERACSITVRSLVLTSPETIHVRATLSELLDAFVAHQAQSLLVTDGEDLIGIVRISDFFDEVARATTTEGDGTCADES